MIENLIEIMSHVVFSLFLLFLYEIAFNELYVQSKNVKMMHATISILTQCVVAYFNLTTLRNEIALLELILVLVVQVPKDSLKNSIKVLFSFVVATALWNGFTIIAATPFCLLPRKISFPCIFILKCFLCVFSLCLWRKFFNKRINANAICKKYSGLIVVLCGIISTVSYGMLRQTYDAQNRELNKYILFVIGLCLLIIFVWVIDQSFKEKKKHELTEEIKHLSSELHKSRELVPAVTRRLSDLKRSADMFGKEEISAELSIVLSEATSISASIAAAAHSSFITNNPLQSTGLLLLDSQLEVERELAALTGVAFDVIVTESPTVIIKDYPISQLELQRILGDLVRNAIHAVERSDAQFAKILLILGRTQQGYQIQLFDTGVPFPQVILSRFGQRGSTTDGTGNGIADILEVLAKCNASLSIRQGDTGEYTKSITILFDGHGRIELPK